MNDYYELIYLNLISELILSHSRLIDHNVTVTTLGKSHKVSVFIKTQVLIKTKIWSHLTFSK
jgi:hypothetical protein